MLSQYCRFSFCREGTAWLLRPACVRFLSNMFLQKLGVHHLCIIFQPLPQGVQVFKWKGMSEYDIIEENTKKIIDSTGNLDDIGKEV